MTSQSDEPLTVRAVHNFKGANNDELNFNKGDIITVTQAVDGGWWEGTLNGLTGWFPSNYVKEFKEPSKLVGGPSAVSSTLVRAKSGSQQDIQQEMKMYRAVVFKDILDTESHHVKELNDFFQNQLTPIRISSGLPEKEYQTLVGNVEEVLECHKQLLASLEGLQGRDGKEQKIGGCFMSVAPQLKKVHLVYCSNHPKAVAVMDKNKEALSQFVESTSVPGGTSGPSSLLPLATGLSAPFRRLEKYPALLQELQRHTEESHIDRGDTQRAVFVYKDISVSCQNLRRQKELELEVMTGNIRNWQGESLESLGDIVQMGCVSLLSGQEGAKKKSDHHLVLFSKTLLVLSVSARLSAFIYKTKIPLSNLTVSRVDGIEGAPHAFEISGSGNQHLLVSCSSKEEQEKWILLLGGSLPPVSSTPLTSTTTTTSVSKVARPSVSTPPGSGGGSTTLTATSTPVSAPSPATVSSHISQLHITLSPNCSQQQPAPPPHQVPVGDRHSCVSGRLMAQPISSRIWSLWSLRPQPPQRSAPPPPANSKKDEVVLRKSQRKKVPTEEKWYEEDMRVLHVIEAYCNSAKARLTVNSALLDTPQVIIAEEEKIIVEEMRGSTPVVQEKSLVDTVYALKDQVKDLKEETNTLSKGLEEERRCRKKLEELVKKHILGGLGPSRDLLSGISED